MQSIVTHSHARSSQQLAEAWFYDFHQTTRAAHQAGSFVGLTSLLCSVPSKPCVSTLASSITYKPNWLHSSYLRQHQTSCCVAVEGKVLGQLGYDAFNLDSPDELPLIPPTRDGGEPSDEGHEPAGHLRDRRWGGPPPGRGSATGSGRKQHTRSMLHNARWWPGGLTSGCGSDNGLRARH